MQGPFAEAWVGGRQFRHIPMNRGEFRRGTGTITIAAIPTNGDTLTITDGNTTKTFVYNIGLSSISIGNS